MPELKRTFSKAKMNKDMDERLVPKGEYRDALNIEIATSEGSDVGTAQSLLGNTLQNTMHSSDGVYFSADDVTSTATCVGSIAADDRDCIYYLVSDGDLNNAHGYPTIRKDYILEYNTVSENLKYVFVDIFEVNTSPNANVNGSTTIPVELGASNTTNITGIREGMYITGTFNNVSGSSQTILGQTVANGATYTVTKSDNVRVISQTYESNTRKYTLNKTLYLADANVITFNAERVLEFNKNTVITGINILDDFLFFTDNHHEPKKINIVRSILGTGGTTEDLIGGTTNATFNGETPYFQTRLVKPYPYPSSGDIDSYEVAITQNTSGDVAPIYVGLEDITVIKEAPTQPLELEMFRTSLKRVQDDGTENPPFGIQTNVTYTESGNTPIAVESEVPITFDNPVDFRVNDILLIAPQQDTYSPDDFDDYDIRAEVVESDVTGPNQLATTGFVIKILSINANIQGTNWYVRLEDKDPLFKFKFPRFSYRYKYCDGEYSPFAPFSQIAFLPDYFEYKPKKGYNLGMVNQLRGLRLNYYKHRDYEENAYDAPVFPQDVVEIDILYKETNNPVVYTVKTIRKNDGDPMWPSNEVTELGNARGSFEVTTDMIHNVVPANQLIRPYDNVPRKALAQEISASRLIYGNYLQNYTVLRDPIIQLGIDSTAIEDYSNGSEINYALPSVKTMRKYQVGVVFSDRHGRETPVLTSEKASIEVPKTLSEFRNRLVCNIDTKFGEVPSWAEYMSWYVKEISSEYYTIAMDRWYNAADGNIYISFPSADRNKLSEEDYLILKKAHGSNQAVDEKSRYKILSIDNEAPDYIKSKRTVVGKLFNEGFVGNNVEGYPIEDTNFIDIDNGIDEDGPFNSVFGEVSDFSDSEYELVITGGLPVERAVYQVQQITTFGNSARIIIVGSFGPEISFTSSNGLFSGAVDNLTVSLIKLTPVNRPEFDGRFFVKIFRDEALEKFVLSQSNESEQYVVNDSIGVRYINNNAYTNIYSPDQPIPVDLQYINSWATNSGVASERSKHPTEYSHIVAADGQYYWGGASSANGDGDAFGLTTKAVNGNPMLALNYAQFQIEDFNDGCSQFWGAVAEDYDVFIDCCTAYTLTGKRAYYNPDTYEAAGDTFDHIMCDAPGSRYQNNLPWHDISDESGILDNGSLGSESERSPYPYAGIYSGSNFSSNGFGIYNEGKGHPSRGIWGDDGDGNPIYMDLSYSGIYSNYTTWNGEDLDDEQVPAHTVQNGSSGIQQNAVREIMEKLGTPGTRFRFRDDPDQTVYIVQGEMHTPGGYQNIGSAADNYYLGYDNEFWTATSKLEGVWGIRNFVYDVQQYFDSNFEQWSDELNTVRCLRQRWTIVCRTAAGGGIGSGPSGYNPIRGTKSHVPFGDSKFRRALHHDYTDKIVLDVLDSDVESYDVGSYTENPAIWETEPKESVDVDLYYQASGLIPLTLKSSNNEELIPIGTTFESSLNSTTIVQPTTHTVTKVDNETITFTPAIPVVNLPINDGDTVRFTKRNHYSFNNVIKTGAAVGGTTMTLEGGADTIVPQNKLYTQRHYLDWNNCWCFGNGVESDRVRDDFNGTQMDNGVKVSSTITGRVREERREHGMIYSGLYNSTTGVNELNQFIAGENITKDLNPVHGSIQALLNRNTRLIMFCEDKVLRADTNKDLIFNADGNSQLVASNKVIGSTVPYKGKYGIGTNPESLAVTPYAVYFTDAMRGAVLRLTNEGLVAVSDKGMKDYFADLFSSYVDKVVGTYDDRKKEYNITVSSKYEIGDVLPYNNITVSYSDIAGGFTSFKSFYAESGVSINNQYYTFKRGELYKHHDNSSRNNFYGVAASSQTVNTELPFATSNATNGESSITVLFNDQPSDVKAFTTINYEGSENRIQEFDTQAANFYNNDYSVNNGLIATSVTDGEYYNLDAQAGWYVDNIQTNLQDTGNIFFKDKEGKYFAYPTGTTTGFESVLSYDNTTGTSQPNITEVSLNKNAKDITVQGLGNANILHSDANAKGQIFIGVFNNVSTTYQGSDGGGGVWDSTADSTNWTVDSTVFPYWFGLDDTPIPSGQYIDLIITPVIAGVYSGIPLSASNFAIGGATESPDNTWTGGNVDAPVLKVEFSDIDYDGGPGVPGSSSNRVKARVHLDPSYTTDGNVTAFIDIDQTIVDLGRQRSGGVKTIYQIYGSDVQTDPTVANGRVFDLTDITESGYQNGPNPPANPLVGPLDQAQPTSIINSHIANNTLVNNQTSEIAKIRFTADEDYYYENNGTAAPHVVFDIPEGSPLEPYYTYEITDQVYTTVLGYPLLTDFTARIYFEPPMTSELFEDFSTIQYLAHIANIIYTPVALPRAATGLASIDYNERTSCSAAEKTICLYGVKDSTYEIRIEKKSSLTSDTASQYYNFETKAFQTDIAFESGTIGAKGVNKHYVCLPEVTSDTRYDIVINPGTTTVSSSIPVLRGQAKILQYGKRTLSIKPQTEGGGSYGTMPTFEITRPYSKKYSYKGYSNDTNITGGNGGVSSTNITLTKVSSRLEEGMFICDPFGTSTIPHLTKINKIRNTRITLSTACTVADNTNLLAFRDNGSVVPFNLSVPPASGKTISLKQDLDFRKALSNPTKVTATNTTTAGTSVRFGTNSMRGIVEGMIFTGNGVVGAPGDVLPNGVVFARVSSINLEAGEFTANVAQNLTGVNLTFISEEITNDVSDDFASTDTRNIFATKHLNASLESGNLKIEGYLNINILGKDSDVFIYLDDFASTN